MNKLKSKISWLLGLTMAKMKKIPMIAKMARHFRLTFPRVGGMLIKKTSQFYWTYQASSLESFEDGLFKNRTSFNEQQRQKKLLRSHTYNSYLKINGVVNNRPVVESEVILERISRNAALHNH